MNRKPEASEYHANYGKYVALVGDGEILDILAGQSAGMAALLRTLPEDRGQFRYEPEKWSIKEVIGHVIDTERAFVYRALCFSREGGVPLPGFDQDAWVKNAGSNGRSFSSLAAEYDAVRRATIAFFTHLEAEAWTRSGIANNREFSVRAIAYIVAGHELHHLNILHERYLSAK
jgi:hypothetical protein